MAAQERSSGGKPARATDRAREAAEQWTFLEKLIRRALPTRRVPAESGVQFGISAKAREDGICLVFRVDDPDLPIVEQGPRPDYLVVLASEKGCVMTIVEMKGREEKNIEHGIEQILAMYRRLRQEMSRCLPGSWRRIKMQGILLMPQNAHINRKKIEDASNEGLEILPLQYHHQAELYPYISNTVSRTGRYQHEKHPYRPGDRSELNPVEHLIAEGKLDQRIRDAFFESRSGAAEDTLFLSFRRPGDPKDAHASLSATTKDAILAFSPNAGDCQTEVTAHLKKHGLQCPALRIQA
ncbi:MAG: hypothetical protein R3B70_03435 [Polyangiaceae bacterium]